MACWHARPDEVSVGNYAFTSPRDSLRNTMMEEALKSGQQHNALELAQLAPEDLRSLLHPFMGGQWQNDTPTLRIPTIARWSRFSRGFSGRAGSIWRTGILV